MSMPNKKLHIVVPKALGKLDNLQVRMASDYPYDNKPTYEEARQEIIKILEMFEDVSYN